MKDRIIGIITGFILLMLMASGIFTELINFLCWLFLLENSAPEISTAGAIIVRILTFVVSYGLVGVLFEYLGWFNGNIMSFVYSVFSALIGFVLAYVVWQIEQHLLIIGIVFGILTVASFLFLAGRWLQRKQKEFTNVPNESSND